jgi:hypothetical protein
MNGKGTASAVPFLVHVWGRVSDPSRPSEARLALETSPASSRARRLEQKQLFPLRSLSLAPVGMTNLLKGRVFDSLPYSRLISAATYPAPNPLSIFTTLTLEAQEFIIPKSAARPLNAAP